MDNPGAGVSSLVAAKLPVLEQAPRLSSISRSRFVEHVRAWINQLGVVEERRKAASSARPVRCGRKEK